MQRPTLACEITADGVVAVCAGENGHRLELLTGRELKEGVLAPDLTEHNVLQPEILAQAIREVLGGAGGRTKDVIAVLPDTACRVVLLDFEELPAKPEEADAVEQTQGSNQSGYSAGSGSAHFTYTIAVSNGASAETLSKLESISTDLVTQGGVPVTGHDRSPYKLLALTAQRQNSPTFYVFDRGLREALGPRFDRPPFTAARIRDAEFNASRDLALSCFRIDDHSIGANNRRRDRLIFSLSQKIVALDVRAGGTMFSECLRAFRQGRSVFVTESDQDGNRSLIDQGCPIFSSLR